MKRATSRRAPEEDAGGKKPRIVVSGDAQAQGIAFALRRLTPIASEYEVEYVAGVPADLERCAFFFEQWSGKARSLPRRPRSCKHVTFPNLRLGMLWPLACKNPYNCGDAENSIGRFPLGDRFVLSCIDSGTTAENIMRLLTATAWDASWPNLDTLFTAETAALLTADAKCDVKIGSYVLKYFRKQRLFWAPHAPANTLLSELTFRLLHAAFGRETRANREQIGAALASSGPRDVMAHVAIPIHAGVARHFALEWYDAEERYPHGKSSCSFEEYFRGMIDCVESRRAEATGAPAAGGA